MEYPAIIVNSNSENSKEAKTCLSRRDIPFYESTSRKDAEQLLGDFVGSDVRDIMVCGGDGSANVLLNAYMNLPLEMQANVNFSFLPSGKANDFVRALGQPLRFEESLDYVLNVASIDSVDVIRVNENYFFTGGGIGLCTDTVQLAETLKKRFPRFVKLTGQRIYTVCAASKCLSGYQPAEFEDDQQFLVIAVMNQPFIGRRFVLAPNANNTDGKVDICYIRKPKSWMGDLWVVDRGGRGKISSLQGVTHEQTTFKSIHLTEPYTFMGDGEMLDVSSDFEIETIPRAIKVRH